MRLSAMRRLPLFICVLMACTQASGPSPDADEHAVGQRQEESPSPFSVSRPLCSPELGTRSPSLLEPALQAWRSSPGQDAALQLAQALFPEHARSAEPPGKEWRESGAGTELQVSEASDTSGMMQLATRGLVFHVTQQLEGEGAWHPTSLAPSTSFQGPRSFWKAQGIPETGTRWQTPRLISYEVVEDTSSPWRSQVQLELPPAVTSVHDAGTYLELLDASGTPLLRLHLPVARDITGRSRHGGARLRGASAPHPSGLSRMMLLGNTLQIEMDVDLSGLDSPLAIATGWSSTEEMADSRVLHTATLLGNGKVLVTGGSDGRKSLASAELYDPATGTWSSAGQMTHGRYHHTATLLPDGQVLVVGLGEGGGTAEVYNPHSHTWRLPRTQPVLPRQRHTATLMGNGTVLVAGGASFPLPPLLEAELYDPVTETWSFTGQMVAQRTEHTATLLPNGQVLVVGGSNSDIPAEVYDPTSNRWDSTQEPRPARSAHTATLLADGKVLIVGGVSWNSLNSVEIYDSTNPSAPWVPAEMLHQIRRYHTATLLPDGKLLITGGKDQHGTLGSTELYDAASSPHWSGGKPLPIFRAGHTATLLPSGKLLVAGGEYNARTLSSSTLYESAIATWASTKAMSGPRYDATATLLPNGRVLMIGGANNTDTASAQEYDPARQEWGEAVTLLSPRGGHTATLLPSGEVLVIGAVEPTPVERYNPATHESVIVRIPGRSPEVMRRFNHTATLLQNGKVLVVGGGEEAVLYDPASPELTAWSSGGTLAEDRMGHTATLLRDGRVLVTGGDAASYTVKSVELYDPITNTWSLQPSLMRSRRFNHTATLLPGGMVLLVGGVSEGGGRLSSAELYNPLTGSFVTTGSMAHPRSGHTATLLATGQVLVVGGCCTDSTGSAEVYDPATGSWSSAGLLTQGREEHGATFLLDGTVLVAGGHDGLGDENARSSAEVYIHDTSGTNTWRPSITSVSTALEDTLFVHGSGFRGISEGSGGNRQSSTAGIPLLSLQSVQNGQLFFLNTHAFSDVSVTALLPELPAGPYVLNVTTHGLTSSHLLQITNIEAPETLLTSSHGEASPDRNILFSFSSSSAGVRTFECSLDGSPFHPCSNFQSQPYYLLSDGPHIFRVRARDLADNVDSTPATHSWVVDTFPPDTSLFQGPVPVSNVDRAVFSFFANELAASLDCSLDNAPFAPCDNSQSQEYDSLGDGSHLFQVRARDIAGNVDPTPGIYSWTVDTTAPETSLFSDLPAPTTQSTSASFSIFSTETPVSFECSLDDNPFTVCDSSLAYDSLSEGFHAIRVRARDFAGNADSTPDSYIWLVDTTPPRTTLGPSLPARETRDTRATFEFSSQEPEAIFECSLDDAPFTSCTSPLAYESLPVGRHDFLVRARDVAGNLEFPPAAYSWSVDAPDAPDLAGYYDAGCSASPSGMQVSWLWALFLLGLRRRRFRKGSPRPHL